ncbi:MAG: Xaa-Pro peptidase family protein [Spirochaetota bacterium]
MDEERLKRTRAAMASEGLDALILRLPENVLLLSGYWPLTGRSFLLFPCEGKPVCIVPGIHEKEAIKELWDAQLIVIPFGRITSGDYFGQLRRALKDAVLHRGFKRIGFEGSFETFAPPWDVAEPAIPAAPTRDLLADAAGTAELIDATEFLYRLRATKTPPELSRLRIANEIGAMGLRAFSEALREGMSGVRLASLVESTIMNEGTGYKGATRVRGFAQVSTGEMETLDGYRLMLVSTTRKVAAGDLAMLELAVVADGFWCDRTRVHVAGSPNSRQLAAFEAIMMAQASAAGAIRAGVTAGAVDSAAREVIGAAGFGDGFFHSTGHGLGFRYHEPIPVIEPGVTTILEAGMVITIEPGIYLPGLGGLRMEDDFLVTEAGSECLGPAESRFAS